MARRPIPEDAPDREPALEHERLDAAPADMTSSDAEFPS